MKNLKGLILASMLFMVIYPASAEIPKDEPLVVVPMVKSAPKIDGKIDDEEWKDASMVTNFMMLKGELVKSQTWVYLAYDRENIYIAFRSFFPGRLKAEVKTRDGSVFGDDAIEVF